MKRVVTILILAVAMGGCHAMTWPHFGWPHLGWPHLGWPHWQWPHLFQKKAGKPAGPQVVTQSKGPLSIVVNPYTGWGAAPAGVGEPVFVNSDEVITELPPSLEHTLVIQRNGANNPDVGYLNGQVKVPTEATLYVAVQTRGVGPLVTPASAFNGFMSEGWTEIYEDFAISEPEGGARRAWRVWYHPVLAGAVTITSDAVPAGGIFFIGRAR